MEPRQKNWREASIASRQFSRRTILKHPASASRPDRHKGRRPRVARPVVVVVESVVVVAIAVAEDAVDVHLPGGIHPGPRAVRSDQRRRMGRTSPEPGTDRTVTHPRRRQCRASDVRTNRGRTRNRTRRGFHLMFDSPRRFRRLHLTWSGPTGTASGRSPPPPMRSGKASCSQNQTGHKGHDEFLVVRFITFHFLPLVGSQVIRRFFNQNLTPVIDP